MPWGSFFNWRKLKIGGSVAAVTAATGTAVTYHLSQYADNFCSKIVNSFIQQMVQNVTIPELSTTVRYMGYNATVTLDDTTVIVPPTWVDMVDETPGVDPICYHAVFTLGICFTICFSLALGAFINSVISDTNEPKRRNYELETAPINHSDSIGEEAGEQDRLLAIS